MNLTGRLWVSSPAPLPFICRMLRREIESGRHANQSQSTVAHNENHDIREGHLLVETGIVADVKSLPALEIYHMSQLRLGLLTTVYTKRGSPFWFLVSYSPDSAGQTTLRCEAYSVRKQHTPLSGEMKKKWGEQLQLKVQEFEKAYRKALRDGPSLSASVCKLGGT